MLRYDKQDQPDQLHHQSDISSNFVKVVEGDNPLYNIITTYEDISGLFYIFTLGK